MNIPYIYNYSLSNCGNWTQVISQVSLVYINIIEVGIQSRNVHSFQQVTVYDLYATRRWFMMNMDYFCNPGTIIISEQLHSATVNVVHLSVWNSVDDNSQYVHVIWSYL